MNNSSKLMDRDSQASRSSMSEGTMNAVKK